MTLASYITSIEHHEITVTDTSNSANLDSGITIGNCVPFVSIQLSGTSDDWDDICCDVYFTAGSPPTVTVERAASGGTVYASVFVVEFDGVNVEVQSDVFAMTSSETTDSVDITAITSGKAFVVSCYKAAGGDDDWDHAMVETSFTDTDTVFFERSIATGAIDGHFYVVEAQGTEFSVQTADITIPSAYATGSDTISEVTTTQTMLIGSYQINNTTHYTAHSATTIYFTDSTTVTAERTALAAYVIEMTVFVVEFAGSETVEHKNVTWTDSDSTIDTDITAVTQSQSILWGGCYIGIKKKDGTSSTDVEGAFRKITFLDSDTVREVRSSNYMAAGRSDFQVIDFEAGGAPPAADEIIKKFNENINGMINNGFN